MYSAKYVSRVLKQNGIAPLKKFGQNFLIDGNIVAKIADAAADENVLEIGPGLGALTEALLARAKRVVAVEIDRGLYAVLKQAFQDEERLTLLNADILDIDFKQLSETYFNGRAFRVAGNLPYYITAKCIMKVLESGADVTRFTAMVQSEVADRLTAKPGQREYGAFTAQVAYYGVVEKLFHVSAGCFYPRPDVESAVIAINPARTLEGPREAYAMTVKGMFSQRRKTSSSILKRVFGLTPAQAEHALARAGILEKDRPETISPGKFMELSKILLTIPDALNIINK